MKINIKYIVWICAILTTIMSSQITSAQWGKGLDEMQAHQELEKRQLLQEQHEQQKQLARTITWLVRFRNSFGPLQLEAATEITEFLSGSSSLQEIEELLGSADEQYPNMWRYRLSEKHWLEVEIVAEQQIFQIALSIEQQDGMTSTVTKIRLYDGTPVEDIMRAWGKPQRKELDGKYEIWFYQFDGDGIWKLLILNRSLKRATYAIIPKAFHSLDRQRLSVATNEPPVISDIDVAIVEFKTASRKKAAPILMPLIQKGVTTQDDVIALLGAPDMISEDRQTYSYTLWYSELLSISFNQYGFVENIFP